ncbi:MAG: hypothetical protein Q9208_004272 [Pyrenodesmia sp. 3 TL-2023]
MADTVKSSGILHRYHAKLVAFEHTRDGPSPPNALLFVPGLSDGLLTAPYAQSLAAAIPSSFSFVEILLSSAYSGWGTSSISQDVDEVAQCVAYFKSLRPNGKIVLMGNSTGCQDVLGYCSFEGSRPHVDGAILQAPVSDREAFEFLFPPQDYDKNNELAQQMVKEGRADEMLPNHVSLPILGARCTARRWLSLTSPGPEHAGEDDMFSSDLDNRRFESTFGVAARRGVALMILYSGNDGFVPRKVDKEALVARMEKAFVDAGGRLSNQSGILSGASHTVKEEGGPREELHKRVTNFLESVEREIVGNT